MVEVISYKNEDLNALINNSPETIWVLVLTKKDCTGSQAFYDSFPEIKKTLDILKMTFIDIDVQENQNLAEQFEPTDTPTFFFISGDGPLGRITGFEGPHPFCSQVISSLIGC